MLVRCAPNYELTPDGQSRNCCAALRSGPARSRARSEAYIGATAHYATPDADKSPIIAQDLVRISHRDTVADLIAKGRDLEQIVLAQVAPLHLENRVLVYNNKTVVFD